MNSRPIVGNEQALINALVTSIPVGSWNFTDINNSEIYYTHLLFDAQETKILILLL